MSKKIKILIGIILTTFIFVIIILAKQDGTKVPPSNQNINNDTDVQTIQEIQDTQTPIENKEANASEIVTQAGSYESYSPEKILRAETQDVVLFFHASWCPSCRSLNSNIEANINSIPEGVNILKVDYDKETDLKKKYGITYQHTLVQVDKDGNLIKKWSGSTSLANLVSEIQ